ncbi:MAG: SMI1/KNR4 family protein [Bifidobacteriaceae bacterium]|jgi:hypothetical protein|nr:SMI1/KNR4 family protein [Bifidobacteriaceae bacterium]
MSESLAQRYLAGLKARWEEVGDDESPQELALATGAAPDGIVRLRGAYPLSPDTLTNLLSLVDGTYHRDYGGHEVSVYLLGSDLEEYPYYLLSVGQILESAAAPTSQDSLRGRYGDGLDEWLPPGREGGPDEGYRDDRIDPDVPIGRWLHFADCMNNGGTSQLFIDFDPAGEGRVGQIIRYLHDPDEWAVIADSFDDYLERLASDGFGFVLPDESEQEQAEALAMCEAGSLSPIVRRALDAAASDAPGAESLLRGLARRIVLDKGFFGLHGDDDSQTMIDLIFWLHTRLAPPRSFEDFYNYPQDAEDPYAQPSFELMIVFSLVADPFDFKTGGIAPGFVEDWWNERTAQGKIVQSEDGGGHVFTVEAETQLFDSLRTLAGRS